MMTFPAAVESRGSLRNRSVLPTSVKSSLRRTLAQIDGAVVREATPTLADAVHWPGGADLPIHRWYRYREGFSPRIVSQLRLGKHVLDPFCGCGSAMLGAAVSGRSSTGLDINP